MMGFSSSFPLQPTHQAASYVCQRFACNAWQRQDECDTTNEFQLYLIIENERLEKEKPVKVIWVNSNPIIKMSPFLNRGPCVSLKDRYT